MRTAPQELGSVGRVAVALLSGPRSVHRSHRSADRREADAAPQSDKWLTAVGLLVSVCTALYVWPIGLNAASFGGQLALYEIAYAFTSIVAVCVASPRLVTAVRNRSFVGFAVCVYFAGLALVVARHPTPWAVLIALEIAGATALAVLLGDMVRTKALRSFLRVSCCFIAMQFAVGFAQVLRNGSVLGPWASETEFGFRRIAGLVGASGTMTFANVLGIAAAILCAIHLQAAGTMSFGKPDRLAVSCTVVLASAVVGLSLCRTAIVAWAVIFVVGMVSKNRRQLAPVLLAMLCALGLSVAARADGWISRGKSSVAGTEAAGSGRMALNRQAIEIFKTDPILGVGLSNYREVIRHHPEIDALSTEDYVVHNAPLFALATTGVVGIGALLPLLGCVVVSACRRGTWGIGVLASAVPILLLARQLFIGIGFMWLGLIVGLSLSQPSRSRAENTDHGGRLRRFPRRPLPLRGHATRGQGSTSGPTGGASPAEAPATGGRALPRN